MSKGFVGAAIKHEGEWICRWVPVDQLRGHRRAKLLEESRATLASQLGIYCGGEAVARRNMVLLDGICPDGRSVLEQLFALLRDGEDATE